MVIYWLMVNYYAPLPHPVQARLRARMRRGDHTPDVTIRSDVGSLVVSPRDALVLTNLRFVASIVKQIAPKADETLQHDLTQSGAVGLTRAVDMWDEGIAKLNTYSYWKIRNEVQQVLAKNRGVSRAKWGDTVIMSSIDELTGENEDQSVADRTSDERLQVQDTTPEARETDHARLAAGASLTELLSWVEPSSRRIVTMRVMRCCDWPEVSKRVKLSIPTCKKRFAATMLQLRERLQSNHPALASALSTIQMELALDAA